MFSCIILWLVWLFVYKQSKINKEKSDVMDIVKILSKVLLVINILLTLVTILNLTSTPPHYKEFKSSVENVMELNAPAIEDCKVSKNKIKIYVNKTYWEQLSLFEKADTQLRIKSTIQTIGENSGYLSDDKKINVEFY